MKKNKIPTLLGLIVLVIGIIVGVFLVKNQQLFKSGASQTASPQNVKITNITNSSLTITWVTSQEFLGFVKWGVSQTSLPQIAQSATLTPTLTHSVTITSLSPGTTYYFKINSGGGDFDNNGNPWQAKTSTLSQNNNPRLASGKIVDSTGKPLIDTLVYVASEGSTLLSTTTSSSGTWVISISNLPTQDLSSLVTLSDTTQITISADGGVKGQSVVQSLVGNSNPVPDIVLGRNSDFRSNTSNGDGQNPNATLQLPDQTSPTSRFNLSAPTSAGSVTVDSQTAGETISTTKPQFFGKGPKGITLNLILESQVISAKVKVDSTGKWKWDSPISLAQGAHKLTISWTDSSGAKQTLVRNFVVQSGSGPAFQASQSASTTPSPTPTPTDSATPTPTPTESPTIEPSPLVTVSPSPSDDLSLVGEELSSPFPSTAPLPATGALTPTLALLMMGIATIVFGIFLWKRSEI